MTNEEVIKNIVAYAYYADDIPEEVAKAFDMVIEALNSRITILENQMADLLRQEERSDQK